MFLRFWVAHKVIEKIKRTPPLVPSEYDSFALTFAAVYLLIFMSVIAIYLLFNL